MRTRSVIIVGASLAGTEVARALRVHGFDGKVVLVGDEPYAPYDRPPLSKAFLAGRATREDIALEGLDEATTTIVGQSVVRLLPSVGAVELSDGRVMPADDVVVATGASARRLRTASAPATGVHYLRTLDDAERLRTELLPGTRLGVVGGGFIGAEVASTARSLGVEVVLIEAQDVPLLAQVGRVAAEHLASLHRAHGVELRTGVPVSTLVGDRRVRAVGLADGTHVEVDSVVVGLGSVPNTAWLDGSGVATANGVLADSSGRTTTSRVWAAGDCAAWDTGSGTHTRREHWTSAVNQAHKVASGIMGRPDTAAQEANLHTLWSDQYDVRIQVAGETSDALVVHEAASPGSSTGSGLGLTYSDQDGIVRGVIAIDNPRAFGRLRRTIGTNAARPQRNPVSSR